MSPQDDDGGGAASGYQSFAGTNLAAHQSDYGFDAQLPLGNGQTDGAPTNFLQFSHLTSVNAQSVGGPGADTLPYLYNQRDSLGDDWLELDHRFPNGQLSLKYDIWNESLTTNYVQGQVTAEALPVGGPFGPQPPPAGIAAPAIGSGAFVPAAVPPVQTVGLSQVQRSAVLRYTGDVTSHIHIAAATYFSNDSSFGTSFDPRGGIVWTPTANTAVRASVGTTYQTPQLSELVVPPPADQVPIGGVIFVGNPDLKPDHATDYNIGAEQIFGFGGSGHALRLSGDLYQSNLRAPSNQLNVEPIPHCQTKRNPVPCPLSFPVNAGNGIYRGIELRADQQVAANMHVVAGWSVDSSYLTVIPESIQDGTLVPNQQTLGQPLHKAYLGVQQDPAEGLGYGARLNYEGYYNELNRSPYATLDAHVLYRHDGFEYGLYGTNLTNVYSQPFTIIGGGIPYGTLPGNPVINPDALILPGTQVTFVLTRAF
jgi:outer membrane receptor protein involved in Fe transport